MSYYVYILRSKKDGSLYTGYTADIKARLVRHNNGKVTSTSNKRPFEVAYFEMCGDLGSALKREKYLKSSKAQNIKRLFRKL